MSAVVDKMLAKNPAQRYQTPAEVIAALLPWTSEPLPAPREDEMPRLSPAVASNVPTNMGGSTTPPARGPIAPTRPSLPAPGARPARSPLPPPAAVRRASVPDHSGRVATLDNAPLASAGATPRVLASPLRSTDMDCPRPVEAAAALTEQPAQAPEQPVVEEPRQPNPIMAAMRMVLLVAVSVLAGVALSWLFISR